MGVSEGYGAIPCRLCGSYLLGLSEKKRRMTAISPNADKFHLAKTLDFSASSDSLLRQVLPGMLLSK